MGVLFKVVWMDQLVPNDRLNIYLDSIRKIYWPKMLQKLSKCENRVPIMPPFYPNIWPPSAPCYPQGEFFFLEQSLNICLHSIRMIYLPKRLQKPRKCENRVPIIVPFYPIIWPPLAPWPPRGEFFFSRESLNIWLESIRKNYLPKMLQTLRKMEKS